MIQQKAKKANPRTLGFMFTIIGAITFFFWGLPPLKYSNESKTWPSVQGTVTKSEVGSYLKNGKNYSRANIEYNYKVDDKTFTSYKITVGDPPHVNNISKAKQMQQKYPVGTTVSVYYDPEAPDSSALKPGIRGNDIMLAGITGLFFVVGILVLLSRLIPKKHIE